MEKDKLKALLETVLYVVVDVYTSYCSDYKLLGGCFLGIVCRRESQRTIERMVRDALEGIRILHRNNDKAFSL